MRAHCLVLVSIVLAGACHIVHAQREYRLAREFLLALTGKTGTPNGIRRAMQVKKVQQALKPEVSFPCKVGMRNSPATSVHALRPEDVSAVGALGDSLTAGSGAAATNLLEVYAENRGLSWSIGGVGDWRHFLTLPNILREFNPNLIGAPLVDALEHQRASRFNAATVGAMSRDLPRMAGLLVRRFATHPKIDFDRDWKLVTILIGANDICLDVCYQERPLDTAELHRADLVSTLRVLRDQLPRTIVNLVPIPGSQTSIRCGLASGQWIGHFFNWSFFGLEEKFLKSQRAFWIGFLILAFVGGIHGCIEHKNLIQLTTFSGKPKVCELTHLFECPCLFGPARAPQRYMMPTVISAWQRVQIEVPFMVEFNNLEDFAVVSQPFTLQTSIPRKGGHTDFSFLSQDCFHLSQRGYARAANALWNNMLEPVGQKSEDWHPAYDLIRCPAPGSPYIFTNQNSPMINLTQSTGSNYNDFDPRKNINKIKGR